MATAVTPNDVADRLGRVRPVFDSPAWLQAQKFIDQADLLITRYQARNALPDPDGADRDYVILEAVAAVVRNPDDATSVDVQIDDGRVSKRYSSSSGRCRWRTGGTRCGRRSTLTRRRSRSGLTSCPTGARGDR